MDRLKSLRLEKGYSQQKLAKLLFVNQTAVSQWERGATSPEHATLIKLSEIFDVSVDYLVGKTDVKNPQEPKKEEVDDHDIKFALFGTTDIDDETYESVKNFAKFAAEQKRKKREGR